MRKSFAVLALLFGLILPLLAACGGGAPTGTTGDAATTAPAAPTTAAAAATEAPAATAAATEAATTAATTAATEAATTGATTAATTAATTGATTEATTGAMTGATTEATTGATTGATTSATTSATTGATTSATSGTAAGGAKLKVGLVTDVGKVNDGGFNQFAYEGLKRAESELGVEVNYIETQAQSDYEKNIDQFATQNYDMIIGVGFLMGDALKAAATKYPNIKFAIVDFAYDPPVPNVRGLVFSEDESGYLAGALAASVSKTGTVAVVGGIEGVPAVKKFVLGYTAGAKSIKPDIDVKSVYIDSFTDRARGGEAAKSFISDGADVIFGAGGQTGSGAIQAAAQQGVFVIGVDQDEYVTTFQGGKAPGADKILSSAIKRVDNAVFSSIKAAQDGSFKGETALYNAANEGVGLAPFHDADAQIPADVKTKLQDILKGLADGSIKTGVTVQ